VLASQNVGEELVGAYLQAIKGCEFVAYNLHTRDTQGEIDVVAINMRTKTAYFCEVAIHLVTGLQYVSSAQPDNVRRLVGKFKKDIAYAKKYFRGYKRVFMLWSPIIRDTRPGSKHSQRRDVTEIQRQLRREGIDLQVVVNDDFQTAIRQLRAVALKETKELKSSVMRLFQIETKLDDHLTSA
jgi:Holliday junction resolvase-like predicted endonuclease